MNNRKKELISLIVSKTFMFIVIMILVLSFKSIFSDENTLIGVTSIVLTLVMLPMDLTIHPIKNLLGLIGFNLVLGLSAFLVSQNMLLGLVFNFAIMAFIGYYFSYELRKPVNMLVGLHYILMLTNPITSSQLPLRLLALVAGAFLIMAAQLFSNRNKLVKSRKKIFNSILNSILVKIDLIKSNKDTDKVDDILSVCINQLKSMIFESGKSDTHLTEYGENTINIISCLEKINIILDNVKGINIDLDLLNSMHESVESIRNNKFNIDLSYLEGKYTESNLYSLDVEDIMRVYDFIDTIKVLSIEMEVYSSSPNTQKCINNELSIPHEFKKLNSYKNLLSLNSPRISYGIRLGLLVSITFFIVDFFNIQFGEWVVYTVFALSQPHFEYTVTKSKKRIIGTIIGSIVISVLFMLITDPMLRLMILMLAGYLMSYMTDYRDTVIFVTICATASAALDVVNANPIIINRVAFILIGIVISLIANKYLLSHSLLDEEDNLNIMQKQASTKMLNEVLLNNNDNKSAIGILSLMPSLIELRCDYLNKNGLCMDKSFINKNKLIINELYQIYLLKNYDIDYDRSLEVIKKYAYTSSSISNISSKVREAFKTTNSFKERLILSKISSILDDISNIGYDENKQTDLYQLMTVFN